MTLENRKGRMIPWAIVAFFAVVIIVNVVVVMLAVDSHPGVETQEAYEKGRLYNQTIALAESGQALGWQVSMGHETGENGGVAFTVNVQDTNSNPLNELNISGVVVRPVRDGNDVSVEFQNLGQGRYGGYAKLPYPGQWEVRLLLEGVGAERAQFIQRINLS